MKAPIVPKKFDKEEILKELAMTGETLNKNPFANIQCNNHDKMKAETYIKNIETFQQVRFDLLYQENQKMFEESGYIFTIYF